MSVYRSRIASDPEARRLLATVPWVLAGTPQHPEALLRALANEADRLAELPQKPLFSLLIPMWNTPPAYLEQALASVAAQTWTAWEAVMVDDGSTDLGHLKVAEARGAADPRFRLVRLESNGGIAAARNAALAAARGDWVAILDHDDVLHPQILGLYAREIHEDPGLKALYCNEVKLSADGRQVSEFYTKPAFSAATLARTNYICHLTAVARSAVTAMTDRDGGAFRSVYDGAEDHDFWLRLQTTSDFRVRHVPVFGYCWRKAPGSTASEMSAKPAATAAGQRAVTDFLGRRGIAHDPVAAPGERGGNLFYSFRARPAAGARLRVIVPYRDQSALTATCLAALETQKTELKVDVLLVDNGSTDPETAARINGWLGRPHAFDYRRIDCPGAFNYSRLNNLAAAAPGPEPDYLLFLNNDVELTDPGTLAAMAGELTAFPATAVVGMRLEYPPRQGGGLQHGGTALHPRLAGTGFFKPFHLIAGRTFTDDEHTVPGVTFAAAMARTSAFRAVGGFDERWFANGHSDTDLCARLRAAGHDIMFLGTLRGLHHESKSRGEQAEDLELCMLNRRHGAVLADQRLRLLGYDIALGPAAADDEAAPGGAWFELPLRYRVADRLNRVAKFLLGPAHRILKRRLSGGTR